LEVRPRWGWRWDCECRFQRSCIGEPVHGSAVSLLPELSTLPRLQLPAVPTTVGGSHTSAQTRTQKSLAVGRCPLLTLSGRALALLGHHSPESGRASSFEAAPVSKRWDAHTQHIAKLSKTSFNGSLPGFSALLVMTFYLVLVTDNVHSTSRPSCSDLLCDFFNTG